MQFKIVHNRIGSDLWANTRLRIVNKIVKGEGNLILDLGCGKGYVGTELSKTGNNVIFAEIDPTLIKNVEGKKIILDAINMPFKKFTFDYVLCADVLEHILDDKKVLSNIYDSLKHGGKAVIAVPAYKGLYGHHDSLIGHYRRYDYKDLCKLAKQVGFKVKYARYACSLLFFPFIVNQMIVKSNKAYQGNSGLERKFLPLLNLLAIIESSIRMPFGIGLMMVLEK
ncbi:MAG: methyltransferase domain-containing protein [archaeon]